MKRAQDMNNYEREHLTRLRSCLPGCTVLLRKNGAFPLDGPCRLEAVGSGVRYTVKGGTGSGEVNSRCFVNVEDGLRRAGFELVNTIWSVMYGGYRRKAKADFIAGIRKKAKEEKLNILAASMGAVMKEPEYDIPLKFNADAGIYVVSRISGEGNDRVPEKGDFMLTDSEVRDILAMDEKYEKFMLVINAGGPVDLSPVMNVGNILVLSQLGVDTGSALADILLGKGYPSGKLATTWARYEDYCSNGDFAEINDTRYCEGIYVGYRYFDMAGVRPLFPFGYGLGYTDFALTADDVSCEFGEFSVTVTVRNTGKLPGRETVQVYVSCPQGRLDKEVKRLAGFAKTGEIAPGGEETVTVRFTAEELTSYDTDRSCYVLEQGKYVILTGADSENVSPAAVYELDEDFEFRQVSNLFGRPDFEDLRNTGENTLLDIKGLPVNRMDLDELQTEIVTYGTNTIDPDPRTEGMSIEDLAYLNTGAFDPKGSIAGVRGDAGKTVPGAAGVSCSLYENRGISRLTMADGPAGVRIARQYYEDRKGKHAIGSAIPEGMIELMPELAKRFFNRTGKPKKGVRIIEQYATAIPIATAVAQSFDVDFARMCGDIVGSEMDIFGVDLWLAPALNIHRNVLCGRNFEYYSEDPLVSGRMAASITAGVQAHKGRGVTIKHYAVNNQETNRYANNSVVSERALREIYLRGFGICIRESDPASVMTSYNLLNGTHTCESRELVTAVLRDEMGFDGLVMTDWWVGGDMLLNKHSIYGTPDPAAVAASGHSLFMPGSKKDVKAIMKGFRSGTVNREQLEENAAWLLHVADRLGKQGNI